MVAIGFQTFSVRQTTRINFIDPKFGNDTVAAIKVYCKSRNKLYYLDNVSLPQHVRCYVKEGKQSLLRKQSVVEIWFNFSTNNFFKELEQIIMQDFHVVIV